MKTLIEKLENRPVLENWPAYKIVTSITNANGEVVVTDENRKSFMVYINGYYRNVHFGSIRTSMIEDARYHSDYQESYDDKMSRAVENGHPTYWATVQAVGIKSNNYDKKQEIKQGLAIDDAVIFEGIRFVLVRTANGNVGLKFHQTQF